MRCFHSPYANRDLFFLTGQQSVDQRPERGCLLEYSRELMLRHELQLVSFISHPVHAGRLLAITSTSLLEIKSKRKCISQVGSSSLSFDWCNSYGDIERNSHDSFGQLTQIYLPERRLREEMALGGDEVLLVDKLNHCIHRFNLSDNVLQSFIGVCGDGDIIPEYKERQLDDLTLHSPVSVSYLIVRSVGHLMIESEQSDLYIVRIQSSRTVAYRQPALEHDDGFVGSGRIVYSSGSQLLSLLISGDTGECALRWSQDDQASTHSIDCDLKMTNLNGGIALARIGTRLYHYYPSMFGGLKTSLSEIASPFDITLIGESSSGRELVVYSEQEQLFLFLDSRSEILVTEQQQAFAPCSVPAKSTFLQLTTQYQMQSETCLYACAKSLTCQGVEYSLKDSTCTTFYQVSDQNGRSHSYFLNTDHSKVYYFK